MPAVPLASLAILASMGGRADSSGQPMQTQSAKDAKYNFGRLIDMARSEPVVIEKHGRPVVVVMAVEEYERLKSLENRNASATSTKTN